MSGYAKTKHGHPANLKLYNTVHESNNMPSTPFSLKIVIFISIEKSKTKANQLQIQCTLFFSNAISNNPMDNLQNHT